jgi:PAS domain S-box-containing protein
VLALLLAVVAAVSFATRVVESEGARDFRAWQARLGILADSRATAVTDWLERQTGVVDGLAQNASLQIYVTELALASGDRAGVTDEAAQAEYLRNLLVVTADRTGFAGTPLGPRVGANVARVGISGLAIVDAQARVLVATPDMAAIDPRIRDFIAGGPSKPAVLDIYAGPGGQPTMAFYAPVTGLQADPGTPPVAGVLGIKPVAAELFALLTRPPSTERTTETLLVRRSGATVEFISPIKDGTPLEKRLALDTLDLAEAFALRNPGGFALRRDYRDQDVLVTGRAIAPVGWALVHKIDRWEALGESDSRRRRLIAVMGLALAVGAVGLIAAWRHGASRRATATAERLRQLSQELEQQAKLLRIVTDSQSAAIFIADDQDHIRFANRLAAQRAGGDAADLLGKTLANALGPAAATRHHRMIREALERGSPQPAVQRLEEDGGQVRIVHVEYIPLPPQAKERPTVLVVEEDITEPIMERERRERTQRHVVQTLVSLLDSRDPFAAHHSQRVAAVARSIAEEMGLSDAEVEAAETAGSLMNIGKVLVAPHVLTRSGELSDDERQQVRQSLLASADLLAGIEFDGPVVDALRHSQERWAGDGPGGLRGDAIPVIARIIAVANAFVAMISARAHRDGVGIDAAVARLQQQSGEAFDRRVVAALINGLENRGGRERWADFAKPSA